MRKLFVAFFVVTLASCAQISTVPLGNDMMEVNVSGPAVMRRANTQKIALVNAAQGTIDMGYDKFIIVNSNGWNETTAHTYGYGEFSANQAYASGAEGIYSGTNRLPESKLLIKMFHYGDKGASKAIDARRVLESNPNVQKQ